jgi:hypothetical protein
MMAAPSRPVCGPNVKIYVTKRENKIERAKEMVMLGYVFRDLKHFSLADQTNHRTKNVKFERRVQQELCKYARGSQKFKRSFFIARCMQK